MGELVARIGITGHTRLSRTTAATVYDLMCDELRRHPAASVRGVTCLAAGADQLFARAVLTAGGTFEAIVPAVDYRDTVVDPANRAEFDTLVELADSVTRMPSARSGVAAYTAANAELLRRCDELFAVWDGARAVGRGETADVVAAARAMHLPVRVLWPADAVRL